MNARHERPRVRVLETSVDKCVVGEYEVQVCVYECKVRRCVCDLMERASREGDTEDMGEATVP